MPRVLILVLLVAANAFAGGDLRIFEQAQLVVDDAPAFPDRTDWSTELLTER